MPRAMQYTKGSIIYFAGDNDERIFILQHGLIILSSTDIETGTPQTEHVKQGEFFGVKSALGHFPREETATVLVDSAAIMLTVTEFETMFSGNKAVIMKMLRVFSNQLRALHRKTESILNSNTDVDQPTGMLSVARSFLEDEQYQACCDVCMNLLKRFPTASNKEAAAKLYTDTKRKLDMQKKRGVRPSLSRNVETPAQEIIPGALSQFSLPAFSRFAKTFEAGTVIITEYEPGDSFYLIQSGSVQLVKCVKDAKKNLDILRPSEFFGEMAILENSPRSATAVAVTRVEVLEFNKENFEALIMGNPQIALILLKLFCKRIYDQRRRLRILVIRDIHARVADLFLMFAEMQHSPGQGERNRRFNLTIQDVSHWVGLPLDVVREEINRLSEKHKIEVYDTYMVVANLVDMRRIVDTRATLRVPNSR